LTDDLDLRTFFDLENVKGTGMPNIEVKRHLVQKDVARTLSVYVKGQAHDWQLSHDCLHVRQI